MERSWAPKDRQQHGAEQHAPAVPTGAVAADRGPLPGERQVVMAAKVMTAASAAVVAGVGLYGLKTFTRLVRR